MKELRTLACAFSLTTLILLFYGAFAPGGAAVASPAIQFTQPNPGALVQGNVTVSVVYRSASGVPITDLEFFVDKAKYTSVKLESPSTEGSYSFVWNTAGLEPGVHTLTAIAYDASKRPGDVAVSVYVDPQSGGGDTQPPTVKLVSPPTGSVVRGIVTLVANALDNTGVNMVLFQLNGRLLFATNHPPYRYNWDTTKVPNGPHSIRVYAYDAADNRGESTPIVVTVDNPSGRTLPNERPSTIAATPEATTGSMAPAPERATAPAPPQAAPPSPGTAVPSLPAPPPPTNLRPPVAVARTAPPPLPGIPLGPQAQVGNAGRTQAPLVAAPSLGTAFQYPDLFVPGPIASAAPGFAAPASSVAPDASSRPTPALPEAFTPQLASVQGVLGPAARDFQAAGRREVVPPATSQPAPHSVSTAVATSQQKPVVVARSLATAETPVVTPTLPSAGTAPAFSATHSRASVPMHMASSSPRVSLQETSGQGNVVIARREVSSVSPTPFASAGVRAASPQSNVPPVVDPAQGLPDLVAVLAAVPASLVLPSVREARVAEPSAPHAPARLAQSAAPVARVDLDAPVSEVVAVDTEGSVSMASLPADTGRYPELALGPQASRLTSPATGDGVPLLNAGTTAPESTHLAARPAESRPLVESPAGARPTPPAKSDRQAVVSAPNASSNGVMVVLMDRRTHRSMPIAVIRPQVSQPSASGTQVTVPSGTPQKSKIVVAPKGSGNPVSVVYNGKPVQFGEVQPFSYAGMTLTPFRHIMEMQGGVVLWNNLIKQVRATSDGRRVEFTIGDPQALVNSVPVQMDAAPFLKEGRAIVPMSFIREALDVVIEYDPSTGRVTIAAK